MSDQTESVEVAEAVAGAALAYVQQVAAQRSEEDRKRIRALLLQGGHVEVSTAIADELILIRLVAVTAAGSRVELASSRLIRRGLGTC